MNSFITHLPLGILMWLSYYKTPRPLLDYCHLLYHVINHSSLFLLESTSIKCHHFQRQKIITEIVRGYHKIRTEMKEMKVCLRNQIQPGIYINGAKDIWAKNFGCVQEMIQRRFRFVFLRVRRKTRGQVGRAIKPEMHLVAIQTQQDINRNEKVLLSKEVSRPTFHLPLWKSPADWEEKENNTPKTLTIITKEIKEAILEEVL